MPQTLAQKLVARAAGRAAVTPGEIVVCRVDLAMFHDSSGPRRLKPMLDAARRQGLGSGAHRAGDRSLRHREGRTRAATIVRLARDWAKADGIRNFHDGVGICHVVLAEHGYLRPGYVRGRRRQPFAHRRRLRRLHVRHRRDRDARRGGDRRDLAARAADDPHRSGAGALPTACARRT